MWTSFKDPKHLYNILLVVLVSYMKLFLVPTKVSYLALVILLYTKESIDFILSALWVSYSV